MRWNHFLCGLIAFGVGLFLAYLWSPMVVEFFKGAVQPLTLGLGLIAMLAVVFDRTPYKKINLFVGLLFLAVGGYGLYDEYIAVKDFFIGSMPITFVIGGLVMVVCGIRHLTQLEVG